MFCIIILCVQCILFNYFVFSVSVELFCVFSVFCIIILCVQCIC